IHVRERPRISKIEFAGERKKKEEDLRKKLFIHVGESYSAVQVHTQIDTLLKVYKDDGYAQISIDALADTTAGPGQVGVRFVIREGEKVKIETIEFAGRTAFPEKRLRKVMKTKQKGFLGGGQIKDENVSEDKDKLEGWYHNHGYRDMKVVDRQLLPGSE